MSKETNENPFGAFNILKGGFVDTPKDDVDDDIKTGTEDIITEDLEDLDDKGIDAEEQARIKAGDDALKKVIEKQSKKSKEEVIEDTEEVIEDDETDLEEVEGKGFKTAITALNDKSILDVDDLEEIEDSEEGLETAIEKTVNKRFEKLLESKLGDEGIDLLNYIEAGGNPKEFYNTYYNKLSWSDVDLESEHNQELALREKLRLTGEDKEDIDAIVEEYKENGTLSKHAKKAQDFLVRKEEADKKQLIENRKNEDLKAKELEKKQYETFKENLLKRDSIAGFKITPKTAEKLLDYITVADKKTGKTNYQKAVESNSEASYLFAYLAMNNFDISKLEKQVASKAASKLASIVKNYDKSSRDKISSGRTEIQTDGDNPFAAFRNV